MLKEPKSRCTVRVAISVAEYGTSRARYTTAFIQSASVCEPGNEDPKWELNCFCLFFASLRDLSN